MPFLKFFRRKRSFSGDTQIRVIGSIQPEICRKMIKNWSEKLRVNFPSTTVGYSLVRIFHLDDPFPKILELEASLEEGQQLQQKDKKRRKRKSEKKKIIKPEKPKDVGHFLKILISVHA